MSENVITGLGVVGNILVVLSYLPQIRKTIVTKSAEDISLGMWALVLLGDICLLIYSISTGDSIFTALFTLFTVENLVLFYLALKYGKVKIKEPNKEHKEPTA